MVITSGEERWGELEEGRGEINGDGNRRLGVVDT